MSSSVSYTDKFAKELTKFFMWMNENSYIVKNEESEKLELNEMLLPDFEEPGRNKLDSYIRELMKTYKIEKEDEVMDDYKLIAKEFKENKPKTVRNKNIKAIKTEENSASSDEEPKKIIRKRVASSSKQSDIQEEIIVNNSIDTKDTYYLNTLDFTTQQLVGKLGEPIQSGEEGDKHRFEWKLQVGENVYTIYDWVYEDGTFDDFEEAEWFLGGNVSNKKEQNKIIEFIGGVVKRMSKKVKKVEDVVSSSDDEYFGGKVSDTEDEVEHDVKEHISEDDCNDIAVDDNTTELFGEDINLNLDDIADLEEIEDL